MPTLKQVKDQIARLPSDGRYLFWTSKEVRALPQILEEDERILAITSGFVGNNTWMLACTDRRIIFLDRGWLYGLKQIQMPLNRINSIDHEIGMAFGTISVWDGATRMSVGTILRSKVNFFVKTAKRAIEEYNYRISAQYQQQMMMQQQQQQQQMMAMQQQQQMQQQAQQPQLSPEQKAQRMNDMAQHLEKLAALRDKGILTEEEFQAQKAKMLQ
jgi:hypothetical protein